MSVLSVSIRWCEIHHRYHISKYEIIRNITCIFDEIMLFLGSKPNQQEGEPCPYQPQHTK
jgi:hypothetical protein